MTKILLPIFFLMCFSKLSIAQNNIIPLPESYKANGQRFNINKGTKIYYQNGLKEQATLLASALSPATGFDFELKEVKTLPSNGIVLVVSKNASNSRESYTLSVNNQQVKIAGNSSAGIFYGIQTLLQMLPVEIYNKERKKSKIWTIDGAIINDAPAYAWRGMMLDVSRYFFSKEYVLKFIDLMAMYKMNVLHFHLIDDAGWRLEIIKYPKLTSIGGWRGLGAEKTGGYYTQKDIREIIAYADKRNVEVVPEIELPAHTLAAIVAYPYLGCTNQQFIMPTQHSISKEIYCVGKERTFEFLEDVFKETTALFPSKYIHIGGDEANYSRWKECTDCQKKKNELGLKNESELQVYFNNRVQSILKKYGKTLVGWDEAIEDGLKEKMVGMIWNDKKKIAKAVEQGHSIVQSLTAYCYFDMLEKNIPGEVQTASWAGPVSLERVYSFNPMLDNLDEKYRSQILGASGTLWADQFIHGNKLAEMVPLNENRSEQYFDYLALPRLSALAEVCWTPVKLKNWTAFESRMSTHYQRYQNAGYGFRLPQPKLVSNTKVDSTYTITLQNVVKGAEIRYTTDGSFPTPYATVYTQPIKITNLSNFWAITVLNRQQYSLPFYFPDKYDRFKKLGVLAAEWGPSNIKEKDFTTLEINATGTVNANGNFILTFQYIGGESRLDINSISIYKNGNKLAEETLNGYAGTSTKNNSYPFTINNYETGAAFTIKANIKGQISNDSKGAIFIKKVD
ncbi:beta-N-acetylhexosaminidase [Pedobacter borealis]|uniref:beta-N-acetylhexosaminidase n=1 Tax=Pedobacter borealis TaxID=475254 RepID=UPI000689DE32|nr:family 20 glycosylhydrolase [Pedobacter borealis]